MASWSDFLSDVGGAYLTLEKNKTDAKIQASKTTQTQAKTQALSEQNASIALEAETKKSEQTEKYIMLGGGSVLFIILLKIFKVF